MSREQAKTLMAEIAAKEIELGKVLGVLEDNNGHSDFRCFVEAELNLPYRRVMFLINAAKEKP